MDLPLAATSFLWRLDPITGVKRSSSGGSVFLLLLQFPLVEAELLAAKSDSIGGFHKDSYVVLCLVVLNGIKVNLGLCFFRWWLSFDSLEVKCSGLCVALVGL